ncbi:MAG: endonuclease/exonuclease/phosphatase family protein [Candidatus Levybacteria bacterium]|nr:endonuclease/exonuclease/phosphatase family protein [Candidatus Levybacteria bacterium]
MHLKFLQLNMYMGKCTDNLLSYLKKEQFDILSLQEVSGGDVSFDKTNTFQRICELGYDGEITVTWRFQNKPHSFFGSAVFFKPEFTLLHKDEIWLKPYTELKTLEGFDAVQYPKAVIGVILEKEGKKFAVFSAHLAWSPRAHDTPEKLRQAKIFSDFLKTVKHPFILSGDFNASPETKIVSMFDAFGRNLTKEYELENTINLRIHRHAGEIEDEGGVVVDYVYVSKEFEIKKFELLEELDLSDHLGLYVECEL